MIWRTVAMVLALALPVTGGLAWWQGHRAGVAAEAARHAAAVAETEARLAAVRSDLRASERARIEAEALAAEKQEALDNAAANDPDAGRRAVGADGVRRLNTIR